MGEMEGNGGDYDLGQWLQRSLQPRRVLIVQDPVPPVTDDNLRDYHGQRQIRALVVQ